MNPTESKIMSSLQDISFKLGEFSAMAKMMEESLHTCKLSIYKHPWPLQEDCKAC